MKVSSYTFYAQTVDETFNLLLTKHSVIFVPIFVEKRIHTRQGIFVYFYTNEKIYFYKKYALTFSIDCALLDLTFYLT